MKYLLSVLTLVFAINANAGLITTQTVVGDELIVDFALENPEVDTFQTTAEFLFDSAQLELASYLDSDVLFGFGSEGVIEAGAASSFFVDFIFFDDASSFGPVFDLGQAVFNILDTSTTPTLIEDKVEDLNSAGQPTAEVSAPSSIALMSLVAGLFFMRKRKNS